MPYSPEKRRLVNGFRFSHGGRYPTMEERIDLFGEEGNMREALPPKPGSTSLKSREHSPISSIDSLDGFATALLGEETDDKRALPQDEGGTPLNQGSTPPRARAHSPTRARVRTHHWNIWTGFL